MINIIKKDITEVSDGVILHGCNCSGGFGSGVAGAIKKKWPTVEKMFKNATPGKLGDIFWVHLTPSLTIFNAYTQQYYGYDGKRYASLQAIKKAVISTVEYAKENNISDIYMPKIGCGLGGLSWSTEVFPMLNTLDTKGIALNICVL